MAYDYYKAVKDDIEMYLLNHFSRNGNEEEMRRNIRSKFCDYERAYATIEDESVWNSNEVTGYASGAYTTDKQAKLYVADNLPLLGEAIAGLGGDTDVLQGGAVSCDVTIRVYVARFVLEEVLDAIF